MIEKENNTNRIINHLLLNASFLDDINLYHGKLGIAITFFLLSKKTETEFFTEVGEELLDVICSDIPSSLPYNLEDGWCGIGVGFEFLIQHHFIEADSLALLQEIDEKIMEWDILRLRNNTLEKGLPGLFLYVLYHIRGAALSGRLPFDSVYLEKLYIVANKITHCTNNALLNKIAKAYIEWREQDIIPEIPSQFLFDFLNVNFPATNDIYEWPLGLKSGCCGYLIRHLQLL